MGKTELLMVMFVRLQFVSKLWPYFEWRGRVYLYWRERGISCRDRTAASVMKYVCGCERKVFCCLVLTGVLRPQKVILWMKISNLTVAT